MARQKHRTLFIGDIHGCHRELCNLLDKVDFTPATDRLIFLGDILNRGPNSIGVLELVHSIPCEVILGNHELGLLQYARARRKKRNPDFERVLEQMGKQRPYYLSWLANLPTFIESPSFLAVHAGLIPGLSLRQHPPGVITRLRTWGGDFNDLDNPINPPWFHQYRGKKLVVYGHWATMGLTIRKHTIGLDSGCVWGGALSALELPGRKITQVKAHTTYVRPDLSTQ